MEESIKSRYGDHILDEVRSRFAIGRDDIELGDGFESFIYAFNRDGRDYILRIGHSLRRSEALIQGEVDWINYLARGGAGVSRAITSVAGRLVERIDDGHGGHFLATAFERAAGGPLSSDSWDEPFLERYGRLIGRLHALSSAYEPPESGGTRPHWDDPIMLVVEKWLPVEDKAILARYRELMDHLNGLPKGDDGYGLIHYDAHGGNFFVADDGQITLFDFDDCSYSWYVNDLAVVLFYAVVNRPDLAGYADWFLPAFMRGYRTEFDLDPAWMAEIPHFLKLREIELLAVIHRSFDVDNVTDPWARAFMDGRQKRISAGVPFLGSAGA